MKSHRVLSAVVLLFAVVLMSLSLVTFAQTQSDAQKSFALLKSLAGTWKGQVTAVPQQDWGDKPMWVTLRVTSRGNAVVHEIKEPGKPDDVSQDDPITMLYVDGERLYLTHYCDAGNRPRMVARPSPDGKKVEFDFIDLSGGNEYGHMYHALFTMIDANHHAEDWTYMEPGDKPIHAHFDLQRVK